MADDFNEILLRQAALLQGSTQQTPRPQYGPSALYQENTRGQRPVAGERGIGDAVMTALNTLDVLDDPGVAVMRTLGVTGRDTSEGTLTRRRVREQQQDEGRGRPGQAVQDQPSPFQQLGAAVGEFARTGTYETPFEDAGFGERLAGGFLGDLATGGLGAIPGAGATAASIGVRQGLKASDDVAAGVTRAGDEVVEATEEIIEETRRVMPDADPEDVASVARDVEAGGFVARDIERKTGTKFWEFIANPFANPVPRKPPTRTTSRVTPGGKKVTIGEERLRWADRMVDNMSDENFRKAGEYINNGIKIEDTRRTFQVGDQMFEVDHWYDLSPIRNKFKEALGDEQGEFAFNAVVSLFAVTSPRTKVRPNATIAINLVDKFQKNFGVEDIMAMDPKEFAKISVGPGDMLFNAGTRTVRPKDMADIRKYIQQSEMGSNISPALTNKMRELAGDDFTVDDLRQFREGQQAPQRSITEKGEISINPGSIGKLLTEGVIDGQKISSFFRNVAGDFGPLTIDIHNSRQTLAMLGYDLSTKSGRRKVLRDLKINADSKTMQLWIDGKKVQDKKIVDDLDPAGTLYGSKIANTDIYGAFERLQVKLKNKLIEQGVIPEMTNAEFQARLWVGSQASVPADTVTAAQAFMDAIVEYGASKGIDNMDDAIRAMWSNGKDGQDVVLNTIIKTNGFAELGIDTPEKLRQLMMRNFVRASEEREDMEESE